MDISIWKTTQYSYSHFHDKEKQKVERHVAVHYVAHFRVHRIRVGVVRHVRSQGNGQTQTQQVLRGPCVLNTLLDRRICRGDVYSPMAERNIGFHVAVSAQFRLTLRQDFQLVHRSRFNHLPYFWNQPPCTVFVVSIKYTLQVLQHEW